MRNLRRQLWVVHVVAAVSVFWWSAVARAGTEPGTEGTGDLDSGLTITKRVDEVNLVFTVTDPKGHFISDLQEKDFELLDNHHPPEQLRYFQRQTELPLRVGLLIDISDSITNRFRFEQAAASIFLKKMLRPRVDQAFVLGFNGSLHLVQDMTGDTKALESSVRSLRPQGETSLYDAIIFASEKLKNAVETRVARRALILITDGVDTKSHALLYDAQQAAARSEVILFALSTHDLRHEGYSKGEAVLDLLAQPTGGRLLRAYEKYELKYAFEQVEATLRSQYAVGYKPAEFVENGVFRSIEVIPRKNNLKAHCRKGYFAPKQAVSR